jgi:hypothetical protein
MNDKSTVQKSYFELTEAEHEAIAQRAVKQAIERMHLSGIATVEVDKDGKRYLRYPDGKLVLIERK